jgi:FlaA1/EpsC-like NDP-sugar epimerase
MSDTVLAGKVAIVTGAGGGIGQAIVLPLPLRAPRSLASISISPPPKRLLRRVVPRR